MKYSGEFIEILRKTFVPQDVFTDYKEYINLRFSPLEKIVFTGAALIMTGFLTAVIAFFIRKP